MTDYEFRLMNAIAVSDYNSGNGTIPTTTDESTTWLDYRGFAYEMKVSVDTVKGIMTSLIKSNLFWFTLDKMEPLNLPNLV